MLVVVVLLMRVLLLRRQLMRLVVRLQTWVQRLELLQVLRCWDLVGAHRLRACEVHGPVSVGWEAKQIEHRGGVVASCGLAALG